MCANFQLKRTTLTFLAQICPKRKLGFEIQKTNVGIRISILEIPCVPIFRQNGQLWIFWPKFGEIAQLRAIFWFKYCWGCCRELGGGWNELGGGGWSWVEVGARFSNTHWRNPYCKTSFFVHCRCSSITLFMSILASPEYTDCIVTTNWKTWDDAQNNKRITLRFI